MQKKKKNLFIYLIYQYYWSQIYKWLSNNAYKSYWCLNFSRFWAILPVSKLWNLWIKEERKNCLYNFLGL